MDTGQGLEAGNGYTDVGGIICRRHAHQCLLAYSLGGLEVSMDNLVQVQVVHATSDAHGPVNQQGRGDRTASPQYLI